MMIKRWMWVFLLLSDTLFPNMYDEHEEQRDQMQMDVQVIMNFLKPNVTELTEEKVEQEKKKKYLSLKLSKAKKKEEELRAEAEKIKNLQAENKKAQQETQRLFKAIILSEKKREKKEAEKRRVEAEKKKKALAKIAANKKREAKKAKAKIKAEKRKEKRRLAVKKAKAEKIRMKKVLASGKGLLAKIDVSQQRMRVYKGKKLLHSWKVSTGKRGFRTPRGRYKPKHMTVMHYSKKYNNSPMPYAVFFKGGYAVHGTRSVRRLGRRASHGCVRLRTSNAKKFYKLIRRAGRNNTRIQIVN